MSLLKLSAFVFYQLTFSPGFVLDIKRINFAGLTLAFAIALELSARKRPAPFPQQCSVRQRNFSERLGDIITNAPGLHT